MSIISAIKDFFKKPEVGGVLLTCGCVVVGAVYDAIKAKTNTDNKKGDDNMTNNKFNDLVYNEAEKLLNELKALKNRRLNNPDVFVYTQAGAVIVQMGAAVVGIASQIMGFISNNNKEVK